jgi:hypothetical protein
MDIPSIGCRIARYPMLERLAFPYKVFRTR